MLDGKSRRVLRPLYPERQMAGTNVLAGRVRVPLPLVSNMDPGDELGPSAKRPKLTTFSSLSEREESFDVPGTLQTSCGPSMASLEGKISKICLIV